MHGVYDQGYFRQHTPNSTPGDNIERFKSSKCYSRGVLSCVLDDTTRAGCVASYTRYVRSSVVSVQACLDLRNIARPCSCHCTGHVFIFRLASSTGFRLCIQPSPALYNDQHDAYPAIYSYHMAHAKITTRIRIDARCCWIRSKGTHTQHTGAARTAHSTTSVPVSKRSTRTTPPAAAAAAVQNVD